MKIAIAIEKFDPAAGGRERSTQQIARLLIERGHQVTIVTNRVPPGEDPLPGGRYIVRSGMDTKYALGLWRFSRWADRTMQGGGFDATLSVGMAVPADVVEPREGTVRQGIRRKLEMKRPGLARKLALLSIIARPKLMTWLALERRTLNGPGVKRIVAISRYVADQLFHYYTLSNRRVTVIPNAAEVRRFTPEERRAIRHETRRALGLGEEDVVFLFVSMDAARKGLPELLRAFGPVLASDPRARLAVAGTHDARWRESALELGIPPAAVKWVGPTREVDRLYAASDVCVLPTWYDPSSKVVLESLLHGVPAISTLHNGASQFIFSPDSAATIPSPFDRPAEIPALPGCAGRVIDSPENIAALIQAMVDLCDDAERDRCALAAAPLADALTMSRHVDELEKVLHAVAEEPR